MFLKVNSRPIWLKFAVPTVDWGYLLNIEEHSLSVSCILSRYRTISDEKTAFAVVFGTVVT